MNTPHKHAALIKQWADGAQIQHLTSDGYWLSCSDPDWYEDGQYRIKPEPKPDVSVTVHVAQGRSGTVLYSSHETPNVVETFDGETGALKSIRMVGKPCPEKMESFLRKLMNYLSWHHPYQEEIKEVLG